MASLLRPSPSSEQLQQQELEAICCCWLTSMQCKLVLCAQRPLQLRVLLLL
jgi:hypothetical protein